MIQSGFEVVFDVGKFQQKKRSSLVELFLEFDRSKTT